MGRSVVSRRRFLGGGAAVVGGVAVGGAAQQASAQADARGVRPRMLRPGDVVRIVSPAGPVDPALVARGAELFRSWGLVVELAPHVFDRNGFLAGSDADRLADLNAALADPDVRAVISSRGGYGTQRIVDGIDVHAVRRDPKLLVGFSDLTAPQLALWRTARLVTIHGPMAAWNDARTGPESAESLRRAMMTTEPITVARDPAEDSAPVQIPGRASGVLLGGNLSLLNDSQAVPDFPRLHGAILFFEEVGEAPYRIDRFLTHMRRGGVLAGLAGIALGQFTNCVGAPGTQTVAEVLTERLSDLGVPVLGGLPIGHGPGQRTIPLGVPATIDVAAGVLRTEPGVRA